MTTGTVTLAPLRHDDVPRCVEIELALFPGDDPWSENAFRSELDNGNYYIGAYADDELIGYAGLAVPAQYSRRACTRSRSIGYWQGKGVGKRLLGDLLAARRRARRAGVPRGPHGQRARDRDVRGARLRAHSACAAATTSRRVPTRTRWEGPLRKVSDRLILGIESSCDETGFGIVRLGPDGSLELLADEVASSVEEHARFGGVVPEVASPCPPRGPGPDHAPRARHRGASSSPQIHSIAVTAGPGLAGALLVGVSAAKAYAAALGKPLYGVNHLAGHVAADTLQHGPLPQRCLALLVSGGHSQLLLIEGGLANSITEIGSTVDDAAGEAYDKVARLLDLPYPGGPPIDKLAKQGNGCAIAFPRGLTGPRDAKYDFSFSGLKTSVARWVERAERAGEEIPLADVAASFQEAVADVLTAKAIRAAKDLDVGTLVISGGVAANSRLSGLAAERCAEAGIELRVPRPTAVHRQRRDDRGARRPPRRGGRQAVPDGPVHHAGPARQHGPDLLGALWPLCSSPTTTPSTPNWSSATWSASTTR